MINPNLAFFEEPVESTNQSYEFIACEISIMRAFSFADLPIKMMDQK
jgi:hypothetical protein